MFKYAYSSDHKIRQPFTDGSMVRFILPRVGIVTHIPFVVQFKINSLSVLQFDSEILSTGLVPDTREFGIADIVERLTVDYNLGYRLIDIDGFTAYMLAQVQGLPIHAESRTRDLTTTFELGMMLPLAEINEGINVQAKECTLTLSLNFRKIKSLFRTKNKDFISGFAECCSKYHEIRLP